MTHYENFIETRKRNESDIREIHFGFLQEYHSMDYILLKSILHKSISFYSM
jgi:hypothetical protein